MKLLLRKYFAFLLLSGVSTISMAFDYETYFKNTPDDFIVEPGDYAITIEYDKEKNDLKMDVRSYFSYDIRELITDKKKKVKYMHKPVMICKAKVATLFTDSVGALVWTGDIEFKSVLAFHGAKNQYFSNNDKFKDPSMRFYEFDRIETECKHIPNFLKHSDFSALLRTNTDQIESFLNADQGSVHSALFLNRGVTYGQEVAANPDLKKFPIRRSSLAKLSTLAIAWDCDTLYENGILDHVLFKSKCSDDLSFLGDVGVFSNGMIYRKIYKEDAVRSRNLDPAKDREIENVFIYRIIIADFLNNTVDFEWILNLKRLRRVDIKDSSISLNISRAKIKSFLQSRVQDKNDYKIPGTWEMNRPNVATKLLTINASETILYGDEKVGVKSEITTTVLENGKRVRKEVPVNSLNLSFEYLPKFGLMMISGNILPSPITCNGDYERFPESIKFLLNKKSRFLIGPDSQMSQEEVDKNCNKIDLILQG